MIRNTIIVISIGAFLLFALAMNNQSGSNVVAQAQSVRSAIESAWKPLPPAPTSTAFPAVGDDAAGIPKVETVSDSAPASQQATVPTPPAPSPAPPPPINGYQIVDASDLFVGTRKYFDKNILLQKMHCYYADVDDYRCAAGASVYLTVFTTAVQPASAREWIEKNCDQLKRAMISDKCLFNPQFVYGANDVEDDIVSGFQQRKVIRPPEGVTMIPSKKISEGRSK